MQSSIAPQERFEEFKTPNQVMSYNTNANHNTITQKILEVEYDDEIKQDGIDLSKLHDDSELKHSSRLSVLP